MMMTKPEFCIITPTSYLEQFAVQSKSHLVLAHLVDTDEVYADFYKKMSERGDFLMMDNSAYELKEPYSPDKLVKLGHKCGAHAIVLPDYPFKPSLRTIDAAIEMIGPVKEAGFKTFFVPQSMSGQLDDWIDGYIWASENEHIDIIGMSILGIPNALPNIHYAYARVVMSQILIERGLFNFDKHHHYLGLNSGVALEIPSLIKMNALDSVDSSGPLWSAILGHEYSKQADSYQYIKKIKMPVDFHIKKTKDVETLNRIQHNINLTLELFDENQVGEVWYAQE